MTGIPKLWFSNLANPITPYILGYCAEHGWDISLAITTSNLINDAELIVGNWVDKIADAGLSVWIEIENTMAGYDSDVAPYLFPPPNNNTWVNEISVDAYNTEFGDGLDIFNAAGNSMKGYAFEGGHYNGITWLKENTSKELVTFWMSGSYMAHDIGSDSYEQWWGPNGLYNGNGGGYWHPTYNGSTTGPLPIQTGTLDWRIEQFDTCYFEVFWQWDSLPCIGLGDYYRENYPTKPFGVITVVSGANSEHWWGPLTHDTTSMLSLADQKRLAEMSMYDIQNATGKFDCFSIMTPAPSAYDPAYIDQLTWWDHCKGLWGIVTMEDMSQTGVRPYYNGASICPNRPPPWDAFTDSFTNTGNELILIKHGNITDSCRVHEITVTSTDTQTHEDYAIACSPDRGTFIGPYPLDDYGVLPTITYDTTNLYVSILKVVPYADQT